MGSVLFPLAAETCVAAIRREQNRRDGRETMMRSDSRSTRDRTDNQKAAFAFGIIYLLVGILGFVPGITGDYSELTTFDDQGAGLFHTFGVNILENIAHLLL